MVRWSSILIRPANRQEERVKPQESNGHYDGEPLKGSAQQRHRMRYVLGKSYQQYDLWKTDFDTFHDTWESKLVEPESNERDEHPGD